MRKSQQNQTKEMNHFSYLQYQGNYLLTKHSRNLNFASDRFCCQEEETPLHLLSRRDALMIKISKNVGQHLIRMEEILNLEATQILNYLANVELNGFSTEPGIFGR